MNHSATGRGLSMRAAFLCAVAALGALGGSSAMDPSIATEVAKMLNLNPLQPIMCRPVGLGFYQCRISDSLLVEVEVAQESRHRFKMTKMSPKDKEREQELSFLFRYGLFGAVLVIFTCCMAAGARRLVRNIIARRKQPPPPMNKGDRQAARDQLVERLTFEMGPIPAERDALRSASRARSLSPSDTEITFAADVESSADAAAAAAAAPAAAAAAAEMPREDPLRPAPIVIQPEVHVRVRTRPFGKP